MFEPGGAHGSPALTLTLITPPGLGGGEGGVGSPVALVEDHDHEDGAAHHADSTGTVAGNQIIR